VPGWQEYCVVVSHGGAAQGCCRRLLRGEAMDLFSPPQAIGAIVKIVIS